MSFTCGSVVACDVSVVCVVSFLGLLGFGSWVRCAAVVGSKVAPAARSGVVLDVSFFSGRIRRVFF